MLKKIENIANVNLEIPSGYYVVCTMTTQTAFSINVQITESESATLFSHTEKTIEAMPVFSADFTTAQENQTLSISVPQSTNFDAKIDNIDVLGSDSELKVRTYIIVAEDSSDADYNDLHLVVTAYRNKY